MSDVIIQLKNEKTGDREFPITHINAVRNSDGDTLPEILARDYPLESKPAAQGGTDLSVVTTGEKYGWNDKYTKAEIDAMRSPQYDATNKRYTFPANATFDYDSTEKRIILSH